MTLAQYTHLNISKSIRCCKFQDILTVHLARVKTDDYYHSTKSQLKKAFTSVILLWNLKATATAPEIKISLNCSGRNQFKTLAVPVK